MSKPLTMEEAKLEMEKRFNASKRKSKSRTSRKPADPNAPPKAKRAKPVPHEAISQRALMERLSHLRNKGGIMSDVYDHLFHIPNGGFRDFKTAKEMKETGVKKGVSDLILPIARGGFFSLYIEFKAPRPHARQISPEQVEWLRMMELQGNAVCLCKGDDEALDAIAAYMSLPPTPKSGDKFNAGSEWRHKIGQAT